MARIFSIFVLVIAAVALSACSFTPVYGTHEDMSLALDIGAPRNRTEQIIYQELVFRLATTQAPNSPTLTITSSTSFDSPMLTRSRPGASVELVQSEARVEATATIRYRDETLFTATRVAVAQYTTESQVMANEAARTDAEERAAKSVAESLRLAILAQYPRHKN